MEAFNSNDEIETAKKQKRRILHADTPAFLEDPAATPVQGGDHTGLLVLAFGKFERRSTDRNKHNIDIRRADSESVADYP